MIELSGILILGILAQWVAWKIRIPAILPLILIGLAVGPLSTFITPSGAKLIDGDKIFQGDLLFDFIEISVALILFEGGLTLKLKEVRVLAGTVRNILIAQTFISMIGGTLAVYLILGLDIRVAMLFGALIIVTGPTVIGPILRNVKLNANINTILKWEGILIDPFGALIAILLYEFIISGNEGDQVTTFALKGFLITISAGIMIGTALAFSTYYILKRQQMPRYLMNVGVLALVMVCFSVSEFIQEESGLLAATVMGMILANLKLDVLKNILSFKEDISVMLVSLLFLILSSRVNMEDVYMLGYRSFIIFFIVVFILRPLTIFIGTWRSNLTINEKLFISSISPRGIVAAGVASIFTIRLTDPAGPLGGVDDASYILPLTFLIILGTVIIQGIIAKPLAANLKVLRVDPAGTLFMGANEAARYLAKFLQDQNAQVLVADTAKSSIVEAKSIGLPVYGGSLLAEGALNDLDTIPYGQFFAMTSNPEINILAMKEMKPEFGEKKTYRLISKNEMENKELLKGKNILFEGEVDYIALVTVIRSNPAMKSRSLLSQEDYNKFISENKGSIIPFFIRNKQNNFRPVSLQTSVAEGESLFYIEKPNAKRPPRETEL